MKNLEISLEQNGGNRFLYQNTMTYIIYVPIYNFINEICRLFSSKIATSYEKIGY